MLHEALFALSVMLMGCIAIIFLWVASSTKDVQPEYSAIQQKAYSFRKSFFWSLLVLGVIVAFSTTQTLPYAATKGETAKTDIPVQVIGHQWYWEIDTQEAKQGDTVVFNVSSADVNHGLGIYDEDLQLLGQTQAMPGYENKLRFTFNKPGNYQLMCMEYCGLAHHSMLSDFTVNP